MTDILKQLNKLYKKRSALEQEIEEVDRQIDALEELKRDCILKEELSND